jgi:hypothetical protein
LACRRGDEDRFFCFWLGGENSPFPEFPLKPPNFSVELVEKMKRFQTRSEGSFIKQL